ncbi:MAG: sigma-70 family RNA polymerase sigma factor [Thermoanaerobaculia bacterium]|nr:sigma-70 family RNA polymerase sigma factor [Thermoanaerobaculia bacterium]
MMKSESSREATAGEVTDWLRSWDCGDEAAREVVFELVYDELKSSAAGLLRRERAGHTLQPTALVHEAYLRMLRGRQMGWQNRCHFFGIASRVMRQVLVDHSRERASLKRGGDRKKVTLGDDLEARNLKTDELLAVDQALTHLESLDAQQVRIVEARFFGGLSVEETAEYLSISATSVKRHWRRARAWLYSELSAPRN